MAIASGGVQCVGITSVGCVRHNVAATMCACAFNSGFVTLSVAILVGVVTVVAVVDSMICKQLIVSIVQ